MTGTPLPSALAVRELLESLLGLDVEAELVTAVVDPHKHPGALVGAYVDDDDGLRALIAVDLALTAHLGASIALMGLRVAEDVIRSELLSPVLYDNAREVLNVAASLFNVDGAPHVRLVEAFAPREILPAEVEKWILARVARLDMEMTVAGYGGGRMSVLVI